MFADGPDVQLTVFSGKSVLPQDCRQHYVLFWVFCVCCVCFLVLGFGFFLAFCFTAEYGMCENSNHMSLLAQAYEYSRSEGMFDSPMNCNM